MDYSLTGNAREFREQDTPKLNYSEGEIEGSFGIPACGLLSSGELEEITPALGRMDSLPVLFPAGDPGQPAAGSYSGERPETSGLGFDLFAAVFYMISRYEEYLPFEADRYGRFEADQSLAGRNGFLEMPVVDLWLKEMRDRLMRRFVGLHIPAPEFRFLPTCDIDMPFAYLHRGKVRTVASRVKMGLQGTDDPKTRKEVIRGKSRDPFDTFREIEAIHSLHKIRPLLFFLTSRYGRRDKSISPQSAVFKDLVKQCMKFADVGIHPSYRASDNVRELNREIRTFGGITGEKAIRSRQHYLKIRLPRSYRNYLKAGIREEYSMGFASAAGFRAGTSRPFYFYDLEKEEVTPLKVIPFQVMDRSLKDYMGLTHHQALDRIMSLADIIRTAGGSFCSIWHNDAFSDHGEWIGWKDVYLQMIDTLAH